MKKITLALLLATAVGMIAFTPVGANAARLITGGDIKNQTIQSRDIAAEGVGTSELRNQTIQSGDIAANGVGTSEIRQGTITGADINDTTERNLRGKNGKDGADGKDGEKGEKGAAGMSGYEVIGRGTDATSATGVQTIVSECAAGERVLSGGVRPSNPAEVTVHGSYASDITRVGENTTEDPSGLWAATSWTTVVTNEGTGKVQPVIVCADIN